MKRGQTVAALLLTMATFALAASSKATAQQVLPDSDAFNPTMTTFALAAKSKATAQQGLPDSDVFNPAISHMARALATTSSSTECASELTDCFNDATCYNCIFVELENELQTCGATDDATCDDLADTICCVTAGCGSSAELSSVGSCLFSDAGCGFLDLDDCDTGGGGGASDSTEPGPCDEEVEACVDDSACDACLETAAGNGEICGEPSSCSDLEEQTCCLFEGETACANNDLMGALANCVTEESDCGTFSFADCSAPTTSSDDSASPGARGGTAPSPVIGQDDDDNVVLDEPGSFGTGAGFAVRPSAVFGRVGVSGAAFVAAAAFLHEAGCLLS